MESLSTMKRYFMTGFCKQERTSAIAEMEKIISQFGYLVDFKMFSDVSISMTIEITDRKIHSLYRALASYLLMSEFPDPESASEAESVVFLNVSFAHGSGALQTDIPAVPG